MEVNNFSILQLRQIFTSLLFLTSGSGITCTTNIVERMLRIFVVGIIMKTVLVL